MGFFQIFLGHFKKSVAILKKENHKKLLISRIGDSPAILRTVNRKKKKKSARCIVDSARLLLDFRYMSARFR
jgi:hypothetical protein